MPEPRQRLLDAAVDHLAAHGLSDLSLRQLAAALGTSHRMLIYHFGSKEGLLVEVVRTVERQQRDAFAGLDGYSPGEAIRQMWRRFADPSLWPHERLFFEIYGQALQGRPHAAPLLDGIVESWLGPAVEFARRHGVLEEVARADARLGVAVMRGLLLDLLATGDRAATDEALERFVAGYEALAGSNLARRPTTEKPSRA
ncbi:TetR/AcrR family transcriptional regulator [Phytohabitans aurantiacus]|uniref:TetR family transcriptional regulator n=1 Tax=Phytohabitans aurantiacus TaxID=3016789 RepID=A0ABQ5QR30_9ACTN|nr:TetR/AcrR family transcriptional regulator [Phytohabitans aurantiacus]GLH97076.1 TetR family transcriptional regulator [Phytohabitans aurantiacus]